MKPKWAKQTPKISDVSRLFLPNERVLNLVHYSCDSWHMDTLSSDLVKIAKDCGENFHGFQLNLVWPEPCHLRRFIENFNFMRFVLQVGTKAVEQVGETPKDVACKLKAYSGVVTDILYDPSGGHGKAFDLTKAKEFIDSFYQLNLGIDIGVAGGLGPDSMDNLALLLQDFPDLNWDAQGQLRDDSNNLDLDKVKIYLQISQALTLRKSKDK